RARRPAAVRAAARAQVSAPGERSVWVSAPGERSVWRGAPGERSVWRGFGGPFRRSPAGRDLAAALPSWLLARAATLGALALAHRINDHLHPTAAGVAVRVHQGLLGWDAGWYRDIASKGYAALPHEGLRFFPLVPLMGRWIGAVVGGPGAGLLVVANASALALGVLLHRLVISETRDRQLARRAAWLIALVPPAYALVMGYSDATT